MKTMIAIVFFFISQFSLAISQESFLDLFKEIPNNQDFLTLTKNYNLKGINVRELDRFDAADNQAICPSEYNSEINSRSAKVIEVQVTHLTLNSKIRQETFYFVTTEMAIDLRQCQIKMINIAF